MKLKLTIASLLLAIVSPIASTAQEEPIPGKVGSVTFALSVTYQEGGYNGEFYKMITETETSYKELYKSIIVKQKYSTAQFVADVFNRFELPGKASDYSVKYVESDEDGRFERKGGFSGFFLVNKAGTVVQCIGGGDDNNYGYDPINTYYVNSYNEALYNETATMTGKKTGDIVTETEKGSYTSVQAGTYIYFNPSNEDDAVECFALVSSGGSYSETYSYNDELEEYLGGSSTYSVSETTVTSLVGTDYNDEDAVILTGGYTVSALKNTADVTAFWNAYTNYYYEE